MKCPLVFTLNGFILYCTYDVLLFYVLTIIKWQISYFVQNTPPLCTEYRAYQQPETWYVAQSSTHVTIYMQKTNQNLDSFLSLCNPTSFSAFFFFSSFSICRHVLRFYIHEFCVYFYPNLKWCTSIYIQQIKRTCEFYIFILQKKNQNNLFCESSLTFFG